MPWWWFGYSGTGLFIVLHMVMIYNKMAESTGFLSMNPHQTLLRGYFVRHHKRNDFKKQYGTSDVTNLFWRNNKAEDNSRKMTIDLSALNQVPAVPEGRSIYDYRSPVKLMGIDVSVLSRHPDPKLPTIRESFPAITQPVGNDIPFTALTPEDEFEDRYFDNFLNEEDVIQDTIIYPRVDFRPNTEPNDIYMFPLMDIPFKALTSYHGLVSSDSNNKRDWKFPNFLSRASLKNGGRYSEANLEQHVTTFLENFILGNLHSFTATRRNKRDISIRNHRKKTNRKCEEVATPFHTSHLQ